MSKKIWEMTQDIQKRINEVAYLMWESAGRHQGMAMDYWLTAEREVLSTMQTAAERLVSGSTLNQQAASPSKTNRSVTAESESPAGASSPTSTQEKTKGQRAPAGAGSSSSSSAPKKPAPSRSRTKP